MKTRLMIVGSALMASLVCLPALAQPAPGQGMGPGMGMGQRGPRDCTQTPNPQACLAHQQARQQAHAACQGTTGQARRDCMHGQMQSFDCAKAGNPQQCEARKKVYQECQGQPAGPAFRQCVQQRMPLVDCSKASDPARCEFHQKARAACKDKVGPEHMACLRAQFSGY
jgi:hypothetical protein